MDGEVTTCLMDDIVEFMSSKWVIPCEINAPKIANLRFCWYSIYYVGGGGETTLSEIWASSIAFGEFNMAIFCQ